MELWRPPLITAPGRRWRRQTIKHPPLNGGNVLVAGHCTWCREDYVAIGQAANPGNHSKFCSKSCARSAHEAKRGRFRVPPAVRRSIYERDGWTCQLCHEAVDPDATDIWRATLDHVVPQSHVLVPDHSPANLRLAHLWCNSVRGDERHYTAADLAA